LSPARTPRREGNRPPVRQIARSIETFGFNVPVLVDAELKVIAGHGLAMIRLWA
jgi:ParB-like chromosome segregation protein Spo0J